MRDGLGPRETRVIGSAIGERKRGRDLRSRSQWGLALSIKSAGVVVEIREHFVVGYFLKVVKTRVSSGCFKGRRWKLVSHRRFVIGRRTFRGAFGAFEAANDPGWQDARRGIHHRWYNGERRRVGGWLACGLKRGVAEENAEGGYREKERGEGSEMKSSPLNEGRLWDARCVVKAKPDTVTHRRHLEV